MRYKIALIVFFIIQINYAHNPGAQLNNFNQWADSLILNDSKVPDTTSTEIKKTETIGYEEVYLLFNYLGLISRTLIVNYRESFFLPIGELFEQLFINYKHDYRNEIITGFYIDPENEYEIDFKKFHFKSKDYEFSFTANDFIKSNFDYYLTTDFYARAFRLNFSVDIRNLSLNLVSKDVLPIYFKYLREKKYGYLPELTKNQAVPLLFPRERSLFAGGFLDYSLSSTLSKDYQPSYNYNTGIGTEILGGDFLAFTNGYAIGNKNINSLARYRWRYAFDRNDYLSYISIGNAISTGINSNEFDGIQLTNYPLEQRESFAKFLISEQTIPGSTVELYINDQLFDYTKTDAAGNFNFWIPLSYGSAFVKLKFYGPNGETGLLERYYQTPYNLNPPGEFNYTLNAGKVKVTKNTYMQLTGTYGVSEWLSNQIGVDYLGNKLYDKPIFYNSLTARITSSYLLNFWAAPNAFYQLSAGAVYPSLTSLNLSFKTYETNALYNPTKIRTETNTSLNLPIYMEDSPLNIQMNGLYQDYSSSNLYEIRLSSSKNFELFTPTLSYSFRQFKGEQFYFKQAYLFAGLIYSIGSLSSPFDFMRGILLNSGLNYNITSDKFDSFIFSAASNVTNNIRLQFDYEHNFSFKVTNARLQAFFELPFTIAYAGAGKDYFTTSLQGSVLFNDKQSQFDFFNREQIGRTVSSFRMFVDANGNGIFDDGEQPIRGARVNVQSLSSNIRTAENETLAADLNPFSIYNVKIDETAIENPILTAKSKLFSFEAGANYVKNIEIPFYTASEISGNVRRLSGNIKSPLPGVKIHIEGIDNDQNLTVNTFSDGSFYYFGLRPGKFKIYLDINQLEMLNLISEPAEILIEIESSATGSSFENLNFELRTK